MFHFQDPVVDWPECIRWICDDHIVKAVDNVQMLDEAKRRNSSIRTVLRHWYTAQVPDGMRERRAKLLGPFPDSDSLPESAAEVGNFMAHADFLQKRGLAQYSAIPRKPKQGAYGYKWLQVPAATLEGNMQRARDFFDSFIDGTFMVHAHNVDYIEEWNEYFGNNQPAEERQRFILWSQAVARVWAEEYRPRNGLQHIRLILANTAVGNDIPVETAQAAAGYDCLLGYHAYWPTRFNAVPPDAWPWYEGRWTNMDIAFLSQGVEVEWALTEGGPILFYGYWPRVTLGPNDGWRHSRVHDASVEEFKQSIELFMDKWRVWNSENGGRCSNPVLFTSGFSGWGDFQIWQPQLSDIAEHIHHWNETAPSPPPAPTPPPDPGNPRVQYPRVYNVLPAHATEEQALSVFRAARERSFETVGYSYDDAGIGALSTKKARLFGIHGDKRQDFLDFFERFYPGTQVEFADLPVQYGTQRKKVR